MRFSPTIVGWLGRLGLALAALAAALDISAAPAARPPGPLSPPPQLAPLPPDLAGPLPELRRAAEEYRGLSFRRPVPAGLLSGAALRKEIDRQVAEEMAPGTVAALDAALKAFGLIPESLDLGTYYPTLLTSQVAAYYDPDRKYLAVVDLGPKDDAAVTKALGAAFAERARQGVLVHELTHALQDQAFDMRRYENADPLSDASAARLALVEGDATATMMDFLMGTRVEALPGAADLMGPMLKDAAAGAPGFPGSREIAAAPAWFRDSLLFSYLRGFSFCIAVRQRGGQKLLDYAFAKDPPRSSEQVLHPEKWYGRRDDPIAIDLPDLAPLLPGARKVAEGELGEEGMRVLLAGPPGGGTDAAAPAAGWGGDRFAVYERSGGRLLAWATEWDAEADATRFLAAAGRLGAGWTARRTAPTRVVLTRGRFTGGPADGEQETVVARLAAARAERPANRPIDLAALGIPPEAPERARGQGEARPLADGAKPMPHLDGRRYTSPDHGFTVELPEAGGPWRIEPGGGADVPLAAKSADGGVVLEVRDRQEQEEAGSAPRPLQTLGETRARQIERDGGRILRAGLAAPTGPYEIEAEERRDGALRHERIRLSARGGHLYEAAGWSVPASWPSRAAEVAGFVASFRLSDDADGGAALDADLQSRLSADGRTFRDPELGLAIRLPQGEPGWHWEGAERRHGAPVALASAYGAVRVFAGAMAMEMPLDALGPMLARHAAADGKGYREIASHLVKRGSAECWEIESESGGGTEGDEGGARVHERRRLYRGLHGTLSVTALGRTDRYGPHEAAVVEALDGVEVSPRQEPPAAPSPGS